MSKSKQRKRKSYLSPVFLLASGVPLRSVAAGVARAAAAGVDREASAAAAATRGGGFAPLEYFMN